MVIISFNKLQALTKFTVHKVQMTSDLILKYRFIQNPPKFLAKNLNTIQIVISKVFLRVFDVLNAFERITFDYILRYPTISQQDEAN